MRTRSTGNQFFSLECTKQLAPEPQLFIHLKSNRLMINCFSDDVTNKINTSSIENMKMSIPNEKYRLNPQNKYNQTY